METRLKRDAADVAVALIVASILAVVVAADDKFELEMTKAVRSYIVENPNHGEKR